MREVPAQSQVVVESFHGVQVADPYRWLEADSSLVKDWVRSQNEVTIQHLESLPEREKIRERLRQLWKYPKYFAPRKVAGRYFFHQDDGLHNQPLYYVQASLTDEKRLLIDPNEFSEDGTVALSNTSVRRDGRMVAYATSVHGSDRQEIRIRDVETAEDGEDVVRWCKFTNIAWHPNHDGFYYSRFPEPGTVAEEDLSNFCQVHWHALGTPQSDDVLVYERPDSKEYGFYADVTDDGQYLTLNVTHGSSSQNRFYYRDLNSDGEFVRLFDDGEWMYWLIGNVGSKFYFLTNRDAPCRQIVAVDVHQDNPYAWEVIVRETQDVIAFAHMTKDHFAVVNLHDAHHELKVFGLDGTLQASPQFPTIGTVTNLTGSPDDSELFMEFTSYLYPQSVFRYDISSGELEPFQVPDVSFDTESYETTQQFFTSTDGTRVPMFITHKKGLELDGNRPTLMYGYGGFNLSQTPLFYPAHLALLEHGGVFAVVTLRGGSEYGEAWHRAGMLANKQNVFDDFHSAGEWLVENGYTNPQRLAIQGRSNGGLLVSATMLQRPDLYGAVVCQVPVTDMLRYHKFTVGRYWVAEYGNAEQDAEHFDFMYAYSPLHNVVQGRVYPPILITTGDSDDRVVPMHSYKLAATLQAASPSVNPVLLRVDTNAGHGQGKPIAKLVDEWTDIYTFLFYTLGIE